MNDDELMHRVRVNDDGRAFRLIVKRYEKPLFWRARGILRSNSDAEDAVQQTFLNLYRFRDRYQPKNSLGAYLKTVLINECFRILRRRPPDASTYLDQVDTHASSAASPEVVAFLQALLHAVGELPPEEAMMIFEYLDGETVEDMARDRNIARSTLADRLARCLEAFRRWATRGARMRSSDSASGGDHA